MHGVGDLGNRGFWNRRIHFKARNQCPDWGEVVVKVAIVGDTDKTWHLTDDNWKEDSVRAPRSVESVTCCSDLSVLCSKSDVLNPIGCKTQFLKSPAEETCTIDNSSAHGEDCQIDASCSSKYDPTRKPTSTKVHWTQVKNLINCNGSLKLGTC